MTEGITLKEYERAEAELRTRKRHGNFFYHATLYMLVNILLIVINVAFFPAYPWFLFPLVLWGIGLLAHYFEAFVWVKSDIVSWEAMVEYEASKIHSGMTA
jgi:2TM domain-containing protein